MTTIRLFRQYLRVPFIVLALIEGLLLFASVYAGAALRYLGDFGAVEQNVGELGPRAFLFAIIMLIGMGAMGLYQVSQNTRGRALMVRLALAFFLGWLGLSLIYYSWPSVYSGRGVMALSALIAVGLVGVIRPVFYHFVDDLNYKRKILVLGTGERARNLFSRMETDFSHHGFALTGFVRSGDQQRISDERCVSIRPGTLRDHCLQNRIREIVVAVDDPRRLIAIDDLLACKLAGVCIKDLMSFYEREDGKIHLELLYPEWLVYSDGCSRNVVRLATKRTFDVVVSLLLLVIGAPIMLLTALAIKLEDGLKAPVLYRQRRVGEHNRVFELMKFRSMRTDAEKDGQARWASRNDDRVTRVGRFIRLVRFDELPQIFNVLRGEMSFVGPRPERPEFVSDLAQKIPYYAERHCLKPGITGWAQIRYPYGASLEDARAKLEYDLYYVKNHSLLLDLHVLLLTGEVILFGRGR